MQKQVRNPARHDENHQEARGDEGEEKSGEGAAREAPERHFPRARPRAPQIRPLPGSRLVQKFTTAASCYLSSADSRTAFSAAWKPTLEWVPSQNGFSVEAPQRQSAIRFSTG